MLNRFSKSFIFDMHGGKYAVVASEYDSETSKKFNIEYRDRRVGYINYHVEGDAIFFIDDLRIQDKAMRPPWFFVPLFFWIVSFPPERWRITNYQKRGLGTAMIDFLKGFAKSQSLKRIEGDVKHNDLKNNPDLLNWYQRRGFTVSTDYKKLSSVAKISLTV